MHVHQATVLIVAARSAVMDGDGQAVSVAVVAGRSATVGTVALKDGAATLV